MTTDRNDLIEAGLQADRLRTDPAFQHAILAIRKAKVDALIDADSTDLELNRRLRAEISAIDDLATEIAMTIHRGIAAKATPTTA